MGNRFIHLFGTPTCNSEELPESDFNFCEPNISASEIRRIFISVANSDPFEDWTVAGEWAVRISETSTDRNAIRPLMVIADKPLPQSQFVNLSMQRKRKVKKNHTINFTIDDVSDTNHLFIQALGLGRYFRVWYETAGGYMFGGNSGIVVYLSADMALRRGQGEIATYDGTLEWNNLRTEDRTLSPIFDDLATSCGIVDAWVVGSTDTTISGNWDAVPGAVAYRYARTNANVDPEDEFATVYDTIGTAGTIYGLSSDTPYYFNVQVVCGIGVYGAWVRLPISTEEAPPVAPEWPVMSGLVGLYYGDYGVEATGDDVDVWEDQSGNENDAPIFAGAPTTTGDIGGLQALEFDGTQGLRTAVNFDGIDGPGKSVTVFVLAQFATPASATWILEYATTVFTAITDGFALGVDNAAGERLFAQLKGNVGINQAAAPVVSGGDPHLFIIRLKKPNSFSQEVILRVDGGGDVLGTGSNNTGDFGSYAMTFGMRGDGSSGFVGELGLIAIYNHDVSAPHTITISNFITTRWGL